MFKIYRNHPPLTLLPSLFWVTEFSFVTDFTLGQCEKILAQELKKSDHSIETGIVESSKDDEILYFAATKALKAGRWGFAAYLRGEFVQMPGDGKVKLYSFVGIPSTLFWLWLFVIGFLAVFQMLKIVVSFQSLLINTLLIITVVKFLVEMWLKEGLKGDIIAMFNGKEYKRLYSIMER